VKRLHVYDALSQNVVRCNKQGPNFVNPSDKDGLIAVSVRLGSIARPYESKWITGDLINDRRGFPGHGTVTGSHDHASRREIQGLAMFIAFKGNNMVSGLPTGEYFLVESSIKSIVLIGWESIHPNMDIEPRDNSLARKNRARQHGKGEFVLFRKRRVGERIHFGVKNSCLDGLNRFSHGLIAAQGGPIHGNLRLMPENPHDPG
jgi:hypothetical protein